MKEFEVQRSMVFGLDLSAIKVKLMDPKEGLGWSEELANNVEMAYKKFLILCAKHPNEPLVPCGGIDDFWHYHILDTLKYSQDCQAIFGQFLHHFPYFGMRGEEDRASLDTALEQTRSYHIEEFGHDIVIANPSKCGSTWCGAALATEAAKSKMDVNLRPV